jgi:hypothetical protein
MATTQDVLAVYDEIDEEDLDTECLIGLMKIHEDGRLEVVAADPQRAAFLEQLTERMNGKLAVTVHSEEPPLRPFELRTTTIERGDPPFAEALTVYLRDRYGLRID